MNNRLLNMREKYELNQSDIGKIVGVDNTVICKWKKGIEIIPLKHLNTISNYYNVSMDYLLKLSNEKNYDKYLNINELNKEKMGKRIKIFRQEYNLSLRALAKELNTTSSTISAYETGKTIILTSFAYQICKKYHISLDWLCGKTEVPLYEHKTEKVNI